MSNLLTPKKWIRIFELIALLASSTIISVSARQAMFNVASRYVKNT